MARVSRSNRKQPAFDPSELTDLIFTPAVGTGVGSHLVGPVNDFPSPSTVASSSMAIVDTIEKSTVDNNDIATVGDKYLATVGPGLLSTVARKEQTTVVITNNQGLAATVDNIESATVAIEDRTTVDITNEPDHMATVATIKLDEVIPVGEGRDGEAVGVSPGGLNLWITEQGNVVPEGRVKQVLGAQDVISAAEAAIYDTLWAANNADESAGRDVSRVVQVGYDYLAKHTELSKRTVQRIVEKLNDKDFIAIEHPADIYQRSSTVYRVFNHQSVLDGHTKKGRLHVVKIGAGVSYVRPLGR